MPTIENKPNMTSETTPEEIVKQNLAIPFVIAANPIEVYQQRLARIQAVKKDSNLSDYLGLIEKILKQQLNITNKAELGPQPQAVVQTIVGANPKAVFAIELTKDNTCWQIALQELISGLLPLVNGNIEAVLRQLMQENETVLQTYAIDLREGNISQVPAQYSLFIWSALSVYWSYWAKNIAAQLAKDSKSYKTLCPVCGSHPISSVITDEPRKGLRYLHCSLCETKWHQVRAECTACGDTGNIHLWAETEKDADIRIESCDKCHGYTKMLFNSINPELEPAIDDLLTLYYDQSLVEQGFKPTTVNPFLLSHEQ